MAFEWFDIQIFLIITITGGVGFVCSIISLYLIAKKPILHNAYGYICAGHSICEGIVLFIFVFWTATFIFIDRTIEKSFFGIFLGDVINFFYYVSQYLHLLKSINRFCAIVFFVQYRKHFTNKLTTLLIVISSALSLLHIVPYFSYDCNYYYDSAKFLWSIRGPCPIAWYLDIINCSVTMAISFACDFTTFCYLYFGLHKKNASLKNDIKFLVQAFLSSIFYLCTMASFHILSRFANTPLTEFLCFSMAWMLCHALNQLSFILFTVYGYRRTITTMTSVHVCPTASNSAVHS